MIISTLLEKLCSLAFDKAFPNFTSETQNEAKKPAKILVTEASAEEFGHFQCNYALQVAKPLKMAPPQIAAKWVEEIKALCKQEYKQEHKKEEHRKEKDRIEKHKKEEDKDEFQALLESVESIEIKGPGFINFRLSPSYLANLLLQKMQAPKFGVAPAKKPLKVIIDYSSPNIAKEMHVGHLRSTIIGDALNRLFRFLGHDVLALNHVGDWGTQFGMLIAYIKSEVHPDIKSEAHSLENATLTDLVHWYKASKLKFDSDPLFKKQAQLEVVALQSGEPSSMKTWQVICEISRQAYQNVYQLLDIDPKLTERGESYYDKMLAATVKKLEHVQLQGKSPDNNSENSSDNSPDKSLVTVSDGAKCIFLEGFTNREGEPLPIILQKSDGGYNYSTTDLAAIFHRVNDEKGDCLLYVVDAGQSLHFQMVFKAARMAGFYDPNKVRVEHVPFGLVLRSDGKKFKTREGETERLIDLIHTAIDKSKTILQERNPEIDPKELHPMAEVLGINAIKYADLACHRESNYVFSYDRMLQFEGNTAAFIMYAYVRILSIYRKIQQKTQISDDSLENSLDVSLDDNLIAAKDPIQLEAPVEIALTLLLCQFEEVLLKMQDDLMPNRLTDYLYRVAEKFHLFFHQCRVEGSPEQNSRLLLCKATAQVLKQGMQLLGLRPLERM